MTERASLLQVADPWVAAEYPNVWERAIRADRAEVLGEKAEPLDAECLAVVHEIIEARGARKP